ncbi:MAG: methylmalonyl Co-A mutase-associated GTPase MeaB [Thermomicrobiales bacterium]
MTLPKRGLAERVLAGDLNALARLASHIENDTQVGREGLHKLYPHTGHAHIVGMTGSPGAGKSTIVNALIHALRGQKKRVAVVAVDPSSPLSGGAALGDRIRMLDRWDDDDVFIRSMASRGLHGGLAPATAGVIHLLDAAKFEVIIVETVGVGQEEVDVLRYVHTVVVVQVPGLGDDIQALKAGLLEIADLFVVNKADREGAEDLTRTLRGIASYQSHSDAGSPPPSIVKTIATTGEGIDLLVKSIEDHWEFLSKGDGLRDRARRIAAAEVYELARREISRRLRQVGGSSVSEEVISDVAERKTAPADGAAQLLEVWQRTNAG